MKALITSYDPLFMTVCITTVTVILLMFAITLVVYYKLYTTEKEWRKEIKGETTKSEAYKQKIKDLNKDVIFYMKENNRLSKEIDRLRIVNENVKLALSFKKNNINKLNLKKNDYKTELN